MKTQLTRPLGSTVYHLTTFATAEELEVIHEGLRIPHSNHPATNGLRWQLLSVLGPLFSLVPGDRIESAETTIAAHHASTVRIQAFQVENTGEEHFSYHAAAEDYVASLESLAKEFNRPLDEVIESANRFAATTKTIRTAFGPRECHLKAHEILRMVRSALATANVAEISKDGDISPEELAKEIEEIGHDLSIEPMVMRDHALAVRAIFNPPTRRHFATFLRNHLTPGAKRIQPGSPVEILPLKSIGLTKHGANIPLPTVAYRIPEDRDLNQEELDAHLVELACGVPHTLDEIRDYAKAFKDAANTKPSNRETLDRCQHVFTTTPADP